MYKEHFNSLTYVGWIYNGRHYIVRGSNKTPYTKYNITFDSAETEENKFNANE